MCRPGGQEFFAPAEEAAAEKRSSDWDDFTGKGYESSIFSRFGRIFSFRYYNFIAVTRKATVCISCRHLGKRSSSGRALRDSGFLRSMRRANPSPRILSLRGCPFSVLRGSDRVFPIDTALRFIFLCCIAIRATALTFPFPFLSGEV
ncbi:ribonucleoside-triphosphate reductase [Anopheles sinensis]|uniref:Ribonucleoside-triphosphate reductase n=1 Tax=Anopheles sinensis TaxID=74873 RepID=A0A084W2S8_ANOSI|nr:ribonucleoside-triphosphate reductase [Anopheles sinensis]